MHMTYPYTLLGCLLMILGYQYAVCSQTVKRDILQRPIGYSDFDGWSILHFIVFLSLGYMYPDTIALTLLLGVGWVYINYRYTQKINRILLKSCYYQIPDTRQDTELKMYSDILVVFMGIVFGYTLAL